MQELQTPMGTLGALPAAASVLDQTRVTMPIVIHSPVAKGQYSLPAMTEDGVKFDVFWMEGNTVRSALLFLSQFGWNRDKQQVINGSFLATKWATLRCSCCADRAARGLPAKEFHKYPASEVKWRMKKNISMTCRQCRGKLEATSMPYEEPPIPDGMKEKIEGALGQPHDAGILPEVFAVFQAGKVPRHVTWTPDQAKSVHVHDMCNEYKSKLNADVVPYSLVAGQTLEGLGNLVVSAQPEVVGCVYDDLLVRNDNRHLQYPGEGWAYKTEFIR